VDIEILPLVMRWLHNLAAITMLGGVIFARFALHPAVAAELSGEAGKSFLAAVRGRWGKVVHVAILVLMVSGIYNVVQTIGDRPAIYHPIFGIKFLLALAVFFLAIALTGRSAATQKIRDNGGTWLTVVLVLGVTIVCLSGFLKFIPPKSAEQASPAPAATEPADAAKNSLPPATDSTILDS
jgi:uncharacterized membrane protein